MMGVVLFAYGKLQNQGLLLGKVVTSGSVIDCLSMLYLCFFYFPPLSHNLYLFVWSSLSFFAVGFETV